jgi:hypothetical protein
MSCIAITGTSIATGFPALGRRPVAVCIGDVTAADPAKARKRVALVAANDDHKPAVIVTTISRKMSRIMRRERLWAASGIALPRL